MGLASKMSCVALGLCAIVLSICLLLQLTGGTGFLLKTINIRVKMAGYFIFLFQVWKNVIKHTRQVLTLIFNCVHAWLCAKIGVKLAARSAVCASKGKSKLYS